MEFDDRDSNYIHVLNNLNFSSGLIYADDNKRFVLVDKEATRTGTGHIHGLLKIRVPEGPAGQVLLPIGERFAYRPLNITFKGNGGTDGYLQAVNTKTEKNFF